MSHYLVLHGFPHCPPASTVTVIVWLGTSCRDSSMWEPINVWMNSKYDFCPVTLCRSADVAIVPKISLALQWIAQIRLAFWFSLMIKLYG